MNRCATTCHQVERDQVMPTATSVQSISVGGGGLCVVMRHMESKRHKDGAKAFTNQATMMFAISKETVT